MDKQLPHEGSMVMRLMPKPFSLLTDNLRELLGIFCCNRNTLKKHLITSVREHAQCICEFILTKLVQSLVLLGHVGTCSKGIT